MANRQTSVANKDGVKKNKDGVNTRLEMQATAHAQALHNVIKHGGLLYLWLNHDSPGDSQRDM